jgi:O-antigen/teichoic acid export membrane protein
VLRTSDDPNPTEATIRPHIIRGSIWMVAMRWSVRGIGLVSTVVLARLLAPADFGLIAMAMLFVGLIEVFGETGQQMALIRYNNPTREHFDSAWTAQIIVSAILGTLVLLAAPLAALYFDEPRATTLVQVLSIRVYAIGFENIGTVLFRKDLDFAKEFRYGIYKKLLSFVVTVVLAVVLRNYWALAIGIVFGQVMGVVLSYAMHPYRPRLCFSKIREIWSFSIWMLVSGVGGYLNGRVDQYIIGGFGSPKLLGHYTVGADFAYLPSGELIFPMSRALFPTYSKLGNKPRQLANAYLNVLSVIAVLALSTSVGLSLVSQDLALVVLGEQWAESGTFIFWLALAAGAAACSGSVVLILQAAADPRLVASQSWMRTLVTIVILVGAAHFTDAEGVAIARLIATLLLVPTYFYHLMRTVPVSVGDLLGVLWRPGTAAAVMAAAVVGLSAQVPNYPPALRLAIEVPAGATVFTATLLALWLAAGRPPGAERAGIRYAASFLSRLTGSERQREGA